MKKIALLLLLCLLAGCASSQRVRIFTDGGDGFAVYVNGEKVCSDSRYCSVEISMGDDAVILDARKDDVVYGQLLVTKESKKNPGAGRKNVRALDDAASAAAFVGRSSNDALIGVAAATLVFPVVLAVLVVPTHVSSFPSEVKIPVAVPNTSHPYPWDQPEK